MFDSLKQYFAPKVGDLRVRDIIRETPEGIAEAWGRPILRSYAAAGNFLTKATEKVIGTKNAEKFNIKQGEKLSPFEQKLYGTTERPTATSTFNETFGEKGEEFSKTKVGSVVAPAVGFALGIGDAFSGGKKTQAVNTFKKVAGTASREEVRAMADFVDAIRTGAIKGTTRKAEALSFAKEFSIDGVPLNTKELEDKFGRGMEVFERYAKEYGGPNASPDEVAGIFERTLQERMRLPSRPVDIRRLSQAEERKARVIGDGNILDLNQYNVLDVKKPSKRVVLNPAHYPKESQDIIKQALEEYRPVAEKRAGKVMSYEQLAEDASKNTQVLTKYIGAEETNKAASLLTSSRMNVARLAEDIDLAMAANDVEKVTENLSKLAEQVRIVHSQASHHGYMLGSLGKNVAPKDMSYLSEIMVELTKLGHNSDDVLKEISKMKNVNDPQEAVEVYRKFVKPKMGDWINLVRYNSMLSSPLTHAINIASTLANSATIKPLTRLVESGFDFVAHGKNRTVFAGEVPAYVRGYVNAVSDATDKFLDVWRGTKKIEQPDLKRYVPLSQKGASGTAYKVLSMPTRLLEAMDQFFMELATKAEMSALTYREGKGVRVAGKLDRAAESAKYTAFRSDLKVSGQGSVLNAVDALTSSIESLRNSESGPVYWISNMTIPFVHTVMNILKQGIEYSPAGFTTLVGSKNKQEQIAKATIGTAVAMTTAIYGMSGRITTQRPKDKNEAELWDKSGKQEYSIKIGDKWVQYSKLPPALSFPIASSAAFQQAFKEKKIDQDTYDALASGLAKAFMFYSDQSYFKGIGDMMDAVSSGTSESWARVASNYPQQLVPFRALSGWMARLMDDTQRTIDGKANFAEKQLQLLVLNIPGLREQYGEAKLDKQGNPIPANNRIRNAFSPVKITDEDARFAEFLNNYDRYAKINRDENRTTYLETEKVNEIYRSIIDADPEEKKKILRNLANENPELLDKVVKKVETDMSGMSPEEILIKNMGVTARAQYVTDRIKSEENKEKKRLLLKHYIETGIATDAVIEYVGSK